MINLYSSRRESLSGSLLNNKLKNAKSYDRIAGYFSSSILEIAGENIDKIEGKVRVICNSSLDERDVKTALLAKSAIRKEWCDYKPEELPSKGGRFKKLYELLSSGKMEVRVLPDKKFGLIHGKAGIITLEDGSKTSFLGSVNESKFGWDLNYELLWEDDSEEGISWVQEEFDALWNDLSAVLLSDFVIEDIKRISERTVIETIEEWREKEEKEVSSVAVESPVYREQLGLWEHQKYFVDLAFRDHKKSHGARYILADQVGLGKTIQLAMSAQLMALYGDKPVLIIVPKTLIWQWQDEMNTLLDMPSAVWNGRVWVDENGFEYPNKGLEDIKKCPRKVGIISQGLIVSKSPIIDHLLNKEYECIVVDEAHRARRKNLGEGKKHHNPEPNNLYEFLLDASLKTKSMLLATATATPIQLYPIELWDLMNILSQKGDSVLGSRSSYWRKRNKISQGLNLIMGKEKIEFFNPENWEWVRNPFPPKYENATFASLRMKSGMADDEFVYQKSFMELSRPEQQRIGVLLTGDFYAKYNPYIRHVIRRERKYLEEMINTETNEPYLKKINVELRGEDDEALLLSSYLKEAYEYAEEFCVELGKRSKSAGFLKTLLLKRIGSSIEAGKNTGLKMLNEWNTSIEEMIEEEDESKHETDIKNLTPAEIDLLEKYVKALETNEATDPKYNKTVELLRDECWIDRGVIIFSQYFDTAKWVAENLSKKFSGEAIGLYAGGSKSGLFIDGIFKRKEKEELKTMVKNRELRVLVGTDSASEGLNLQTLGSLINLDLPWNPTRLEQRKEEFKELDKCMIQYIFTI